MAHKSELLICNTNDGERSRLTTHTAGDVIQVNPAGFEWGRCECIKTWVKEGRARADFPNDFLIIETDMPLVYARELQNANMFPLRVRNYCLDLSLLPTQSRDTMSLNSKKAMRKGGKTRHYLTKGELDVCLLPRAGRRKPSEFR